MSDRVKILAQAEPWYNGYELLITSERRDGRLWVGKVTFEEVPEDTVVTETIRLKLDEGQALIDSLWASGLRPTEGNGSAGAFAAQGRHLEDMRKLVFETRSARTEADAYPEKNHG